VSTLEIIAALLSLIAIILVVKRSMWNYPFGIAGVLLYVQVFYDAKLYSDALLQIYFIILQGYGWWNWMHHRDSGGVVIVKWLDAHHFSAGVWHEPLHRCCLAMVGRCHCRAFSGCTDFAILAQS
jgi:nicotinamide mononucleotide transporter PnuC